MRACPGLNPEPQLQTLIYTERVCRAPGAGQVCSIPAQAMATTMAMAKAFLPSTTSSISSPASVPPSVAMLSHLARLPPSSLLGCTLHISRFSQVRRNRILFRAEASERGSSVRTNGGRNKKWRTLDNKGRLEGNKRTRGNGNGNPGKVTSPRPGPDKRDGTVQAPEDPTDRADKPPRGKPTKGPKPRERVTWAGQKMLLLNPGDRFKIGQEVTPWASVRTERMPDDYYKYGPFGPHAWKGVCVGTPRRGTFLDNLVVFFSSVQNEEEHELGDIQDAITGYAKRVDQMDERVGVQFFFAFVRQVQKTPGQQPPWKEWTLVAQVAVESGEELDKWSLGSNFGGKTWEHLSRSVAWFRPDLIYVKRPAYQVRFEPQKAFLKELLRLLKPGTEAVSSSEGSYFQKLVELLGVEADESAEQVGITFDGFSEERKMECVEHVLTSHPVWLLYPFTTQTKHEEQQESVSGRNGHGRETESPELDEEEGDWSEDESSFREDESDFEAEMEAFNEESFDFDAQDDSQSVGNEWEREEAKALAAEAMQNSPSGELHDVDDEFWNEEAVKALKSSKGERTGEETVKETETQEEAFLDAAVRPFTYTNLIKEIFIIRKALVDYPQLRG